ncbi:MAG TPA: 30S ribosomal protein S4 [Candidatus Saccharimonadales bacterium]
MARDRSPITKQSRREGYALHNKAHKILVKRQNMPGQSPNIRMRRNVSQFGVQLREKQKVKRLYGLLERQFRRMMKEAGKSRGKSGEVLLQLLERRLDNVIYRAGFAISRRAARQLVSHGHFEVNDKRLNIPSYRVEPADKISVRQQSRTSGYFANLNELTAAAETVPISWLKVNKKQFKIEVTGLPVREDAEANINEQLIVEYYSK